jgi:hypothetical protein
MVEARAKSTLGDLPKSVSSSKSPCRLRAIPDCFYDRLVNIDKSDLSLSVQTSCSTCFTCLQMPPLSVGTIWTFQSASGSMRSGLIGGCSSIAGVAFGTIFFLIGDPQPGQSCGFPASRNFSPLLVGPTFAFMRSFACRIGPRSGGLAVALSRGTDLFPKGRPFPR